MFFVYIALVKAVNSVISYLSHAYISDKPHLQCCVSGVLAKRINCARKYNSEHKGSVMSKWMNREGQGCKNLVVMMFCPVCMLAFICLYVNFCIFTYVSL